MSFSCFFGVSSNLTFPTYIRSKKFQNTYNSQMSIGLDAIYAEFASSRPKMILDQIPLYLLRLCMCQWAPWMNKLRSTASQGVYVVEVRVICVEKSFRLKWGTPRSRVRCQHTTGGFTTRFPLALQGVAMTSVSDTCLPNVRSRHNRLQVTVFAFNLQNLSHV